MNAIAERFVRSIKNGDLDNYLLISHKQITKIIKEYIEYYNYLRPHQGIRSIPEKRPPDIEKSDFTTENIFQFLFCRLHHHYYMEIALFIVLA